MIIYATDPLSSNLGDVAPPGNPNGNADVADHLVLTRLATGAIDPIPPEPVLRDVDDNGSLDGGDLVPLLQLVLGAPAAP